MRPTTFYLSAMQWLLLTGLASLAVASPIANPGPIPAVDSNTNSPTTSSLTLFSLPDLARREADADAATEEPGTLTLHERQNAEAAAVAAAAAAAYQAKMILFRACCDKAVASIKPDPLRTLGISLDQLIGLYVAGGMLAFGGELSEFGKRIVWQQLSLAVMLCGSRIF